VGRAVTGAEWWTSRPKKRRWEKIHGVWKGETFFNCKGRLDGWGGRPEEGLVKGAGTKAVVGSSERGCRKPCSGNVCRGVGKGEQGLNLGKKVLHRALLDRRW